jgi:hypothetical protein
MENGPHMTADGSLMPEPGEHLIRKRAHEIWIEEGKPEGRALDHWLRARWELEQAPDPKADLEQLERELEPAAARQPRPVRRNPS